jgi:hypothetical protein
VQVAAAKSICGCIVNCQDPTAQDSFKPALPLILQVAYDCLMRGDEAGATDLILKFVDIADSQPSFYKGNIDTFAGFMKQVS